MTETPTGDAKPTVEEAVERLWLKVLYDDREIERPSPNTIVSAKDLRTLLADRTALVSRIKELEGALRPFAQATPSSFIRDEEEIGFGVLVGDLRAAARVITEER